MSQDYTIGIDFGTESGRAVLVRTRDGAEIATSVHRYAHGVIDEALPHSGRPLPPDWALQHPEDYLDVLRHAVPDVLRRAGVAPEQVAGVGIDFTACTMLPCDAQGVPLCTTPEWRDEPHAWVKLWKHHAAQPQADRINELARRRGERWLSRYGGKISSEWFFAKTLQILEEAPEVYRRADRLIEAGDWTVWRLTGSETRSVGFAGYKAMYQDGFPDRDFFAALHPELADVVDEKMQRTLAPLGGKAGELTEEAAAWTGLPAGTPVAVANVDAHVTLPVAGDVDPGTMVLIMGTSTCAVMVGEELQDVEGMAGVVRDGIVPGAFGYEAGQSGVGDIFAWFVDEAVPPHYVARADAAGISVHALLEREAAAQAPGEHGLVALDWLNGNRSVLVDVELSGALVGLTLATTAPEVYRALLESTAFGLRVIVEAFEGRGVPVHRFVAAGGLPGKNALLMQIYADVLNRRLELLRSDQGPAVGSAMHAAVAAGAYPDIEAAAARMGGLREVTFAPDPERAAAYDDLFAEYRYLHDLFGRSGPLDPGGVMKRLRAIRARAREGGST